MRPERFVTQKIVKTACRIAAGSREKLHLGDTGIKRDWGWAPEYVEAMWMILQNEQAEDFVIATGQTNSLESFVATTFDCLGLDWNDHVVRDESLIRPAEITENCGNYTKAKGLLGWQPVTFMAEVVKLMVDAELGTNTVKWHSTSARNRVDDQ